MVASTYPEAIRRLLLHEGGYTNHPNDPGGPTNFGITLTDYRKYINKHGTAIDVRNMSKDEAKAIYKAKYWVTPLFDADRLPPGVDYSIFDYGVNSGWGRSGKVLRRVLGLADNASNDAVYAALAKRKAADVVQAINTERLGFLKRLKTWPTFGKGWERRVAEVNNFSLALAKGKSVPTTTPDKTPGKGETPKPPIGKVGTGAGGTVAATGGYFWDWVTAHPGLSILIVAVVAVAVGWTLHSLKQRRDAKQIARVPETVFVPESV